MRVNYSRYSVGFSRTLQGMDKCLRVYVVGYRGEVDYRGKTIVRIRMEDELIWENKLFPLTMSVKERAKVCKLIIEEMSKGDSANFLEPYSGYAERLKKYFAEQGYIQVCSYCGLERERVMGKVGKYSYCSRRCRREIEKVGVL